MSYGALTKVDVGVLETVLALYRNKTMKFLEVGIHTGQTGRGIKDFCDAGQIAIEYWGVDNGAQSDCSSPFYGAFVIRGDSAEVFHEVPPDLDVAFIDGCHCGNHVILDTILYGARVKRGGFMLFHDTAPQVQKTMRDPHGPDISWFYNSVLAAHELMKFPTAEWELFHEEYDCRANTGGMKAFRKL